MTKARAGHNALPVALLLTPSPLLRAAVRESLGAAEAAGFRLRCATPRDRDLARLMGEVAPRVVLVPYDEAGAAGPPASRQRERDLRLIARLVQEWRAPVIALGSRPHVDEPDRLAAAADALAAGAVSYLPHERWAGPAGMSVLLAKTQAAMRVKVLRPLLTGQFAGSPSDNGAAPPPAPRAAGGSASSAIVPVEPVEIVAIGASAGGPAALRELLCAAPAPLPAPVLIVQHMPPSFGRELAAELSRTTPFRVVEARAGERLAPGGVYLVPGRQAAVVADGRIAELVTAGAAGVHGQAIDRTMISVAAAYGARAVGVILTGMGEDGVQGLAAIKARGGRTFGQDEGSCLVYGMPGRAAAEGVVDRVASPAGIGEALRRLLAWPAPAGDAAHGTVAGA